MAAMLVLMFTFLLPWGTDGAVNMTGCVSREPYPLKLDIDLHAEGEILSPGYGEQVYPNNLYCEYILRSPSGSIIKLTFEDVDVEPEERCGKDALRINDGASSDDELIGVYCGTEGPGPIYSSRNGIRILFTSDYMAGRKGFRLRYKAILRDERCPGGKLLCKNNNCYSSSQRCDGTDNCGDGTDEEKCTYMPPLTSCGVPPIEPLGRAPHSDRVIGGQEARIGSWPWQADLQAIGYHPNAHVCGGTLINAEWVLTALHCLQGRIEAGDWRIHLGNHHKFKKDKYEQVRYVQRIVIYPGYTDEEIGNKPVDLAHDIALMKLSAPIVFTDGVQPACLPPQSYEVPPGTICYGTGWGSTRGSGYSDVLKQVDFSIRRAHECTGYFLNATMVCVKNDKGFQDVCHGDSGGPLVCKIGDKWNVIGITSFQIESNLMSGLCALSKSGTVYNKVSAKTDWIKDMLNRFA